MFNFTQFLKAQLPQHSKSDIKMTSQMNITHAVTAYKDIYMCATNQIIYAVKDNQEATEAQTQWRIRIRMMER